MLCIIEKHRKRESLSLHISGSNDSPAAGYLISEKFFKKKRDISLNTVLMLYKINTRRIVLFKDDTICFWKQFMKMTGRVGR
jgi:hypothetical protein